MFKLLFNKKTLYTLVTLVACPMTGTTTSQELQNQIDKTTRENLQNIWRDHFANMPKRELYNYYYKHLRTLPPHIESTYHHLQDTSKRSTTAVYNFTFYMRRYKQYTSQFLFNMYNQNKELREQIHQLPETPQATSPQKLRSINCQLYSILPKNYPTKQNTQDFLLQRTLSGFLWLTGNSEMHADQNLQRLPSEEQKIRHYLKMRNETYSDYVVSATCIGWNACNRWWNRFSNWINHPNWRTQYGATENTFAAYLVGFDTFNRICDTCEKRGIPLGWLLMKGIDTHAWTENQARKHTTSHQPTPEQQQEAKDQTIAESALYEINRREYKDKVLKNINNMSSEYDDELYGSTAEDSKFINTFEDINQKLEEINHKHKLCEIRKNYILSTLEKRQQRLEQYGTTNPKRMYYGLQHFNIGRTTPTLAERYNELKNKFNDRTKRLNRVKEECAMLAFKNTKKLLPYTEGLEHQKTYQLKRGLFHFMRDCQSDLET